MSLSIVHLPHCVFFLLIFNGYVDISWYLSVRSSVCWYGHVFVYIIILWFLCWCNCSYFRALVLLSMYLLICWGSSWICLYIAFSICLVCIPCCHLIQYYSYYCVCVPERDCACTHIKLTTFIQHQRVRQKAFYKYECQ